MNETRRAVAPTWCGVRLWLHKDMVQCVINRFFLCPFLVYGALRRISQEGQKNPSPKEWATAVAALYFFRPPGRTRRRGPELFGPVPFAFRGSRRLWCVKPSTRASCLTETRVAEVQMVLLLSKTRAHRLRWNREAAPPLPVSREERPKTVPANNVQVPRTG